MTQLAATSPTDVRYLRPGWFTKHVFNRAMRRLARIGVSPLGLRELSVRGRSSGEWRSNPVNLLELDGLRYLVAPRGETQWVRNLRVAKTGRIRLGRRVEEIVAVELADDLKIPVLREYLRRFRAEVQVFFEGVDLDASDAQLAEIAPGFPAFEVRRTGPGR
jgi:hypothetical protein